MSADPARIATDPVRQEDERRRTPRSATLRPSSPAPGRRGLAAIFALLAAGTAALAAAMAVLEPDRAALFLLVATLVLALLAALALGLRLHAERREAAALAARLEALEDENWELEEARAGVPTGGVASGFEPALSIATVSHELRAPLHGMHGLADLLAETDLSAEQRSYVEALGQSTAALERVVDDLLDASRIATGHFSLDPSACDIGALLEQVAELMAPRAFAKGLSLSTQTTGALPRVDADAGRLRQVLVNLVANAVAFSDQGGIVVSAERVAETADRLELRIAVSDSGRGVDPGDQARIFGPFERGADGGGAGLGLAISGRIVEHMGSGLVLSPRAGGGSVFSFTLDLPIVARPADSLVPALSSRRLLLAARSQPEADALAGTIVDAGGEVTTTSTQTRIDGLLASAAAAGQPFDALLVDIDGLPDAEAAPKRLRTAAGGAIGLVALIEPAGRPRLADLRQAGFDAYLVRPVRRASLLRVVAALTDRRGGFVIDPADREETPAPHGRQRLRALVIEDDPVSALLVRAVLERLGHAVTEASDRATAHAALAARGADLVLVDMKLGSESGAALISELRGAQRGGPRPLILAMSADKDLADRALSCGADRAVTKPVTPDSLRQALADLAGSDGQADSLRHQTV